MTTKLLLTRAKEHLFSTRPPRALSLFRKRLSLSLLLLLLLLLPAAREERLNPDKEETLYQLLSL